ncbi:response regulator [Roseinatronobacter monicus]|uniref:DNA-binding transcriptional regulator NtrC n=1 Tax=Roseinatronobacter monicus TaxID=393481 RepID=A0A543KBA2_9RHOB|nr:response regulator [Roseinatronobacter monicus]TQM92355.1 two-component system nitrogen regulation response regulator GlnG [Roseinatronobacter monicus]
MDGTVLVADDDRTIRTVLTQALTRAGCKVHATSSLTTLMRWVEEGRGDLVITDVMMPDGNGIEMIPKISQERPDLPVIVISAQNTIMTAIQANEVEAHDYLPKPFDLPDLLKRAGAAMKNRRRVASTEVPTRPSPAPRGDMLSMDSMPLVGRTPVMQELYRLIARVINSAMPVLILGESGTGKSLIACTLHDLSDRRNQPFVAATGEDLNTFDGAQVLLSRVRGGTLLFDEILSYDTDAQLRAARLLDALPEDGPRVMATAQGNLTRALAEGGLREDLYYRLGGVVLNVPTLRERIDDLEPLSRHFLSQAADEGATLRTLSPEAMEVVRLYSWPGNVRQLQNTLRRLGLTSADPIIARTEIEGALHSQPSAVSVGERFTDETLSESVARHLRRYFDLHGQDLPPPGLYGRILREMETPLIELALDATGGNQARCADLLGINRNTLRKKITELDIPVSRRRKLT